MRVLIGVEVLMNRYSIRRVAFASLFAFVATLFATGQSDPLPSWNEGPVKRSIIEFVSRVTRPGGPGFVPTEQRIATFDNDGTLWVEKPLPNEVFFVVARVRELAAKDPTLKDKQPFKAVLEGDANYFHTEGEKALVALMTATHTGMTQEQFAEEARNFVATAKHPKLNRPFTSVAYQPMLELLAYLRANGFEIWLSSGGTIDFMRVFSQQVYSIPPERIVGTEFKRESRLIDNRLSVFRLPEIEHINDKEGKPVGIDRHIGMRPLFVGGNVLSGGDIAMMQYSKGRNGPSFQLLINHDDATREFAYQEKDNFSLNAAKTNGFTVVSMRSDWKTIFPDVK